MNEFLPELMIVTDDFIRLIDISRNSDNVVVNFEQLCNRLGLESEYGGVGEVYYRVMHLISVHLNAVITTKHLGFVFSYVEGTCTLILGRRLGFLQDTYTDVMGHKLAEAIRGQFRASRDAFYGLPLWKIFNTASYKEFIHCEDTIYE
jgi:ecdysone 20-monooxygenase